MLGIIIIYDLKAKVLPLFHFTYHAISNYYLLSIILCSKLYIHICRLVISYWRVLSKQRIVSEWSMDTYLGFCWVLLRLLCASSSAARTRCVQLQFHQEGDAIMHRSWSMRTWWFVPFLGKSTTRQRGFRGWAPGSWPGRGDWPRCPSIKLIHAYVSHR